MTRTLILALALFAGTTAYASSDASVSQDIRDKVTAVLTQQGYEVRSVKADNGYYEAYAIKDGQRSEIKLDKDFNIMTSESDD